MIFYHWLEPGHLTNAPIISWYIEGADKKILVDTGGGDPATADPKWQPYWVEGDNSLEKGLKKMGLTFDDIDIVVTTHLHWDHSIGNDLFPKAQIIVQEEELKSARSPYPIGQYAYRKSIVEDVKYTVVSGDTEIAKGVKLIFTPGHTYGMQGVLVEAETQKYFISGDTFGWFKNLEVTPHWISGIYVDLKKYYESIEKISKLSATILPGHDFKVFEREVYS